MPEESDHEEGEVEEGELPEEPGEAGDQVRLTYTSQAHVNSTAPAEPTRHMQAPVEEEKVEKSAPETQPADVPAAQTSAEKPEQKPAAPAADERRESSMGGHQKERAGVPARYHSHHDRREEPIARGRPDYNRHQREDRVREERERDELASELARLTAHVSFQDVRKYVAQAANSPHTELQLHIGIPHSTSMRLSSCFCSRCSISNRLLVGGSS